MNQLLDLEVACPFESFLQGHSLPSSSLAITIPVPPAPPNGMIPDRIEVNMASPRA